MTQVQILNNIICISHAANIIGIDMYWTILHQNLSEIVGQTWLFKLVIVNGLEKEKLNSNLLYFTLKLTLGHILLMTKLLGRCIHREHWILENTHSLGHKWKMNMRHFWCNDYHHRKWTQQFKFKSWMRLSAFQIELIL